MLPGVENFRDLGGLPLKDGGVTPSGVLWRSGHLDELDDPAWAEFRESGITTIIDLRNAEERLSAPTTPDGIEILHRPLEDVSDPEYTRLWGHNWATPEFYAWGRQQWPHLWAAVLTEVADARGGVLVHCAAGRDRTGMMVAVILETAGVEREAILNDYTHGIRGSSDRGIDVYALEYRHALNRLLDQLDPEPELKRAAQRLR
jgi:protein tyrosine/serine phosphatase